MKKISYILLFILVLFTINVYAGPVGYGSRDSASACADNDTEECLLSATRSSSDANFTAGNIKSGINILNVTGTFADAATAYTASTSGSPYYVTLSTSGIANSEGSWTEVISSTSTNSIGFILTIPGANSAGVNYLVDVGTGAVSSEVALVSNIISQYGGVDASSGTLSAYIPLPIASGTRISARVQSASGSVKNLFIHIHMVAGTSTTSFTTATTYGSTDASSSGTTVDPGGSANTKGSYTQLTASSSAISYMLLLVGSRGNTVASNANFHLDIATGSGGSEIIQIPDIYVRTDVTCDCNEPRVYAFPYAISAGTRIAVRAASGLTDATDRLLDVVIIGFN